MTYKHTVRNKAESMQQGSGYVGWGPTSLDPRPFLPCEKGRVCSPDYGPTQSCMVQTLHATISGWSKGEGGKEKGLV